MDDKSLTGEIYQALVDGLKIGLDWAHFLAKYGRSKGPLYSAFGRFSRDMEPKVRSLNEVQAKLDQAGLKLDSLDQKIKAAESSLAPLEDRRNVLNQEIEALETKFTERTELLKRAGELEKLGFDIERLRHLQEVLKEIGAKSGLTGKEAVGKFCDELKDYDAKTGFEREIQRLGTITDTKKLEAEKWQAEEEALKRRHDDLKEAIGAVYALRAKGVKATQIPVWQRIVNRFETVEEFDKWLSQYSEVTGLLNARKEDAKGYELRLAQVQSQVETLQKDKAKIEAGIESVKESGIRQIETTGQAVVNQLKEIRRKAEAEVSNYVSRFDQVVEKAYEIGATVGQAEERLSQLQTVREVVISHEAAKEKK